VDRLRAAGRAVLSRRPWRAILLPYLRCPLTPVRSISIAPHDQNSLVPIMTMIDVFASNSGRNATFSIRETGDGAYQIMIEPYSTASMLPVGSPFEAADKAKAWIDTESASWFGKFRRGV
jgi:hypothetical protein